MKGIFLLAAAVVCSVALSSCNTAIGLGRDLRLLGEGMEKTAQKKGDQNAQQQSGAPVY
jgi:predicted small secreted protein